MGLHQFLSRHRLLNAAIVAAVLAAFFAVIMWSWLNRQLAEIPIVPRPDPQRLQRITEEHRNARGLQPGEK